MIGTLAGITLRGLLNRRRTLWLALLGVLLVGVSVLYRLADQRGDEAVAFTAQLLANFGVAVLLPLVAVIVGTAALGSEIEDGTIIYLLARPVARSLIVAAKLIVCWLVVAAMVAIPIVVAGLVAGPTRLGLAYAVASIAGALEYTTVFIALSLITSRALVIGLAYVIVWEGVVGSLFAGTRPFSVRQHVLAIAERLGGDGAVGAELELAVAIAMAGAVTALGTLLAVRRLQRVELRGETA